MTSKKQVTARTPIYVILAVLLLLKISFSPQLLQYANTMDKCLLEPAAAQRSFNNSSSTAAGVDNLIVSNVDADMVNITVSTAGETNNISQLEL